MCDYHCEEAFQTLKFCITSALTLALPDKDSGFEFYRDTSKHALGCVVMLNGRAIMYAS